jgi:hypothetical protein
MKNQKGLSVDEVKRLADEFLAEYNGNIPVKIIVGSTQEALYGPEVTTEKIGKIEGAYHGGRAAISLAAANICDKSALRRTLRHELLGHYGLNTFKAAEKRALLDKVLETRQEPSLKDIWDRVDRNYANKSELIKAEEVFAFVAEQERNFGGRAWDGVLSTLQKVLRRAGLADQALTQTELRHEAQLIAGGIRNGTRQQQNSPKTDLDQFRIENNAVSQPHPIGQHFQRIDKPIFSRRPSSVDFEL